MSHIRQLKETVEQLAEALDSPRPLAEAFAELDDREQARFFMHVAAIAMEWNGNGFLNQAHWIGRALKGVDGEAARRLLTEILAAANEDAP